jgi:hypothetical protein
MCAAFFLNQSNNQWQSQLPIQTRKHRFKWEPVPPRFNWPRFGKVFRAASVADGALKMPE